LDGDGQKGKRLEQQILAENQKSNYPCLHDQGARFHRPKSLAFDLTVLVRGQKGHAKFCSAKIPRNLLKMLDSDERIQGNPSFSNPHKRGFSWPNGPSPRKPKPVDRTERRPLLLRTRTETDTRGSLAKDLDAD
jgi:hypothetical protein